MRPLFIIGAVLAGVGLLAAGAVVAVAWVASDRAIHPEILVASGPEFDPESYGFPYETVTYRTSDGVEITAWWFPGPRREAVVAIHGFRYGRDVVMPNVNVLRSAGYNVLAPTLRGSAPLPQRRPTTLGFFEQRDVIGAVDWLRSRPEVDPDRIALLGISMGAATAIMSGGADQRVRAVVAESAYENVPALIGDTFEYFLGIPAFPFGPLAVQLSSWRAGIDIDRVDPLASARQLAGRPLLLIHGLEDTAIAYRNSVDIYQAAPGPRGLWLVSNAQHANAALRDLAGYTRRVLAFLEAAFADRPLPADVSVTRVTTGPTPSR